MSPIEKVIINEDVNINPIWIMRQAGRYLPEFRKIREKNTDFIKLCLDQDLSTEITLQPLKRFDLDAAIIFSDILMLPYGLGQKVEFKKNFGPILGELDLNRISKIDEVDFVERIYPVYKAINKVSKDKSATGGAAGGGMTEKGVKDYKRKNPGSKLKTAVTGKVKKGSAAAKRRKSYCARSAGQMKKFPKAAKNPNSRLRQARRRWKC